MVLPLLCARPRAEAEGGAKDKLAPRRSVDRRHKSRAQTSGAGRSYRGARPILRGLWIRTRRRRTGVSQTGLRSVVLGPRSGYRFSWVGLRTGVPVNRPSSVGFESGIPTDRHSSAGWGALDPPDRSSSAGLRVRRDFVQGLRPQGPGDRFSNRGTGLEVQVHVFVGGVVSRGPHRRHALSRTIRAF
jgi:hypothetical protein